MELAIVHLENKFGKIFNFYRVHDKGITGRLEVHLYKNTLTPEGNNYLMIHSKNASGETIGEGNEKEDAPTKKWANFVKLVEVELNNPNVTVY
jgi:hypothetical protein